MSVHDVLHADVVQTTGVITVSEISIPAIDVTLNVPGYCGLSP